MEPGDSAHERGPAEPGGTPLSGMRILLVDDYTETQPRLPNLIRSWGCIVEVCYTDLQCIELAGSFDPDAVLISLGVISINDVWIVRKLRSDAICTTRNFFGLARHVDDALRVSRRADGFSQVFHRHDGLGKLQAALMKLGRRSD